jgi:tetratricopeptide (TPR) repeat protein
LLRRIAFSHFKCRRYDKSERVLKELLALNPNDRIAERWLSGLEDARTAGNYEEAAEVIGDLGGLAEEGVELSSLGRAAIENCTFEGVDPAKVQAGTVGAEDVAKVEDLAKQLGTKLPRDRAAYYLSAAALVARDPSDSNPARIYDYLRRYFTSMADASWFEKKPADVVRSYYTEALALVFDDNLDEAWRSLLMYLATFSPAKLEDVKALLPRGRRISPQDYVGALQSVLEMIAPDVGATWFDALFGLGSVSSFARRQIGDVIHNSTPLRSAFASMLERAGQNADEVRATWQTGCLECARTHRQQISICRTLTEYKATVASMEDLDAQLLRAL